MTDGSTSQQPSHAAPTARVVRGGSRGLAGVLDEAARAREAVLRAQVLAPGEQGLADVAQRVARALAEAEPRVEREAARQRFAALIARLEFLPALPTLANAGLGGQLAACFALACDDSLDSIYSCLARAARIQQGSGGVGVDFSALRAAGAPIRRSGGRSPGPLAFVELFGLSAHVLARAGRRAGAHLAILRDDHPDVLAFVESARAGAGSHAEIGLALSVSDALLVAAREGRPHALRDPAGGAPVGEVDARALLAATAESILATGNPTLLFADRMDQDNPTPGLGRLRATNPCGEQPLLPDEACVLGSLNLPAFADERGRLDMARLRAATADAVRCLDDMVECNRWPDERVATSARATRKIGLGVMGFADLLLRRGLAYESAGAERLAAQVMAGIARVAQRTSAELAAERGAFPAFEGRGRPRRNATLLAVAPTGTLRLLAGVSGGLEPWIEPVLEVPGAEGGSRRWVDESLARWSFAEAEAPEAVLDALAAGDASDALPGLAARERRLLRRAWEIAPRAQLAVQAAFQAHVDGGVSKTVHLSHDATPEQAIALIHEARRLGCKGIALYVRRPGGPAAAASCPQCGALVAEPHPTREERA